MIGGGHGGKSRANVSITWNHPLKQTNIHPPLCQHTAMASTTPFDITKLLQAPKKWTPGHLEGLNIQEHHRLPAAAIVGDARLPANNDPCNYIHPPILEYAN